jgi:Flp pilus assembly protein TadG
MPAIVSISKNVRGEEMICRYVVKSLKLAVSRAGDDHGAALIEMAISSAVLLATFVGIMQLTMACYVYNAVNEVARDSARWAMVRGNMCSTNTVNLDHCNATSSDIQDYAKKVAAINWSQCTSQNPCLTATWMTGTKGGTNQHPATTWSACGTTSSCKSPGNLVVVSVSYPYSFNVPFLSTYSMTMGSTAQVVISQ